VPQITTRRTTTQDHRYLLEERLASAANPNQEIFEVVIFEQNSQAGGVWNLTGSDDQFATPMYPACRSIVPIDLLQYSGISYDEDTALFPKNPSVAKYLLGYAHNLETRGLIRYKTEVLNVSRQTTPAPDQMTWRVKTCEYGISGSVSFSRQTGDILGAEVLVHTFGAVSRAQFLSSSVSQFFI